MLVLFATVFLLFGAPAILLYAGRLIQSKTDAIHHGVTRPAPAAVTSGDEWYFHPARPLFGGSVPAALQAAEPLLRSPVIVHGGDQWFHRPLPPLFVWPDLRRFFRRSRAARSV